MGKKTYQKLSLMEKKGKFSIYSYNATGKSDNRNKRPRIHTINHTQRCFSLRPVSTSVQSLHLANDLRQHLCRSVLRLHDKI